HQLAGGAEEITKKRIRISNSSRLSYSTSRDTRTIVVTSHKRCPATPTQLLCSIVGQVADPRFEHRCGHLYPTIAVDVFMARKIEGKLEVEAPSSRKSRRI